MEIWYFDTSAVNWFCDKHTAEDMVATKALQSTKGREWVISPIVLQEILSTAKAERRDDLIYKSQRLFSKKLIISPEEMIIRYINKGFPRAEDHGLITGKSELSSTWQDIVINPDKTMGVPENLITPKTICPRCHGHCYCHKDDNRAIKKNVAFAKEFNKIINVLLSDEVSVFGDSPESVFKASINDEYNKLKGNNKSIDDDTIKAQKIAIFYIRFILCKSLNRTNPDVIDKFWMRYSLFCEEGRFRHAMDNFQPLVYRGPLFLLSLMVVAQAATKESLSRGLYADSLHAMYVAYSDYFLTGDNHFIQLRESLKPHPIAYKIVHVDEIEFFTHDRKGKNGIIYTPSHTSSPIIYDDDMRIQSMVEAFKKSNDVRNILSDFLSQGIDIDKKDEEGNTVLIHLSQRGLYDIVGELIVKHRANVNEINACGNTALIAALFQGNNINDEDRSKTVNVLLVNGANKDISTFKNKQSGHTALVRGVSNNYLTEVSYILEYKDNISKNDLNNAKVIAQQNKTKNKEMFKIVSAINAYSIAKTVKKQRK